MHTIYTWSLQSTKQCETEDVILFLPTFEKHLQYICRQLELLQQSTTDWVAYKQQKFISHSFGGRELEIKVPAQSGSGEHPLSGCRFLVLHSHGRESMLSHNSQKGTESAREDSTLVTSSYPNYISEAPPPNTTTLRTGVSTYEFSGGGGCKHSVHKTEMIVISPSELKRGGVHRNPSFKSRN